jgi:hypothetical protein
MSNKTSTNIQKVAIGLLLVFILFYALGLVKKPLMLELNTVNLEYLVKSSKNKSSEIKKEKQFISDSLLKKQEQDSIKRLENQKILHLKPGLTPIDTPEGVERVLLLGDSQLEGLRSPVSAYCEKNGHVLLSSIIYYGSSTKQWGSTDTLAYFLNLYKPSVVLFAIGLNELFVNDLDQRVLYMKKIIETFEKYNVRYLWIGPAAWTKDRGIVSKMKEVVGDFFFPSHELILSRAADGRHPSKPAAKVWFDKVAISCTEKKVIDFSKQVDTLPALKYKRTILMNINDN